jgi:hypothetical protein
MIVKFPLYIVEKWKLIYVHVLSQLIKHRTPEQFSDQLALIRSKQNSNAYLGLFRIL